MKNKTLWILIAANILSWIVVLGILGCFGCGKKPIAPVPQPHPDDGVWVTMRALHDELVMRVPDNKLMQAAQEHAEWMFANRRMSHVGEGNSTFAERIKAQGYNYWTAGENIAHGYGTPEKTFQAWLNSPGHKRNIEDPDFHDIGIGVSGDYWCVVFATQRSLTTENVETETYLPEPLDGEK